MLGFGLPEIGEFREGLPCESCKADAVEERPSKKGRDDFSSVTWAALSLAI